MCGCALFDRWVVGIIAVIQLGAKDGKEGYIDVHSCMSNEDMQHIIFENTTPRMPQLIMPQHISSRVQSNTCGRTQIHSRIPERV